PEFLNTPRTGIDVAHRILLVFSADGAIGNHWPNPRTARGSLESRLDDWLGKLLPDPAQVACQVQYTSGGQATSTPVTLRDLNAGPLDVLAMALAGDQPGHSELEQRILYAADLPAGVTDASIAFANPPAGSVSFLDPLAAVDGDLLALLPYGVPGCVPLPRNRQDPTQPPGGAEIQALYQQGTAADRAARKRVDDATAYRAAHLAAAQRAADVIAFLGKVM